MYLDVSEVINERVESNIQGSRKEYEAAIVHARRSHQIKKAAAFWICVQQQRKKAIWKREMGQKNILGRDFAEL